MKEKFLYAKEQSIVEYTNLIQKKFNDISLCDITKNLSQILGVDDKNEISKIEKAGLISFGDRIGILTFEDACNKLNINPDKDILALSNQYIISVYKLTIIIEALNDGWKPNWNDGNEKKWYPYFDMGNGTVSFSNANYDWYYTSNGVFSPLYLKSNELAEYCGKHFIELYKIINKIN